jgi:hypothetical protein
MHAAQPQVETDADRAALMLLAALPRTCENFSHPDREAAVNAAEAHAGHSLAELKSVHGWAGCRH